MKTTTNLEQFREELYQTFNKRADTLMELIDAISSYPAATSVVELSLAPCYRRSYSTISKAINEMHLDTMVLPHLIAPHLLKPRQRAYQLLGTDVTPQPRTYAHTLSDRGMVYEPTVIKGNKPITIGHQYSTVCWLPEDEEGMTDSWVVPLMTQRVATDADKEVSGTDQLAALLKNKKLPFGRNLCVHVADSSYSKPACLHKNRHHSNLVDIARLRGTRTLYRQPPVPDKDSAAGHPKWYGEPFKLPDERTWHDPDDQLTLLEHSRRGKHYRVELEAWHNMLMRGKRKPVLMPMHKYPFTLIRIMRYHVDDGTQVSKKALWLLVVGARRAELTLQDCHEAYGRRYNLEHFFRFGKQKLLLSHFQTPETWREENWWQLVHIAYAQLWVARTVAACLPRPWERNLPAFKRGLLSPTAVRRDFGRIIRQIGTPAQPPKPRGISPGRAMGTKLPPRPKRKVIVKSQQ